MQEQIEADFKKFEVVIFSDGACHPNPGPGGWAAILLYRTPTRIVEREICGGVECATSNRMEIQAVVEGLEALKRPCDVKIYSDSRYVVQSIGHWRNGHPSVVNPGWVHRWKLRSWMSSTNEQVKNVDMWERVMVVAKRHKVIEMEHIRGHVGIVYNERCDRLAVAEKKRLRVQIKEKNDGKLDTQAGRLVRGDEEGDPARAEGSECGGASDTVRADPPRSE